MFQPRAPHRLSQRCRPVEPHLGAPITVAAMHDDRSRLREALGAALAAAQDARAPERVIVLLQGAYRSLESAHFVDAEMIRWAEASLGAWRRWSATRDVAAHRLLVVDPTGALGATVRTAAG